MKKFFHFVLLVTLSFVAVMPATGQITITSSDVGAYLAPGNSTTSRVDTGTHTANIGTLGATSWDFSAFVNNFSITTVTVRPDTTAFFSFYPSATHAFKTGAGYTYYALATNLEFLGYAQPPPTEIRTKDIPPQIIDQLPMTMGTTWTATYAESSYVTISGTTYKSVTNHVVTYTVDAYGNLTLPGGGVHQALRVKSDRHSTTGVSSFRSITYQFLAKDGAAASVVPADTNQPQTGTISVSTLSWNLPGGATSVEEIPGGTVPSSFALEQNYPNPFNPSTTIEFDIPRSSFVKLVIVNALGEEVASLVNKQLTPGKYRETFNAGNLPSGVYFYKLQTSEGAVLRKMLLLR